MKATTQALASPNTAANRVLWINKAIEFFWLLTVVLVPLVSFGRNFGEWSSVIGSFELPKIALLRTLVGAMAVLWLVEWLLQSRSSPDSAMSGEASGLSPKMWPNKLVGWLRGQPARWLSLAVGLYLAAILLSTVFSGSFSLRRSNQGL